MGPLLVMAGVGDDLLRGASFTDAYSAEGIGTLATGRVPEEDPADIVQSPAAVEPTEGIVRRATASTVY